MAVRIIRTVSRLSIPSIYRCSPLVNKPFLPFRAFSTANPDQEKPTEEKHDDEKATGSEEKPVEEFSREELLAEYTKLKDLHSKAEEEVKSLKNKLAYALADIDNVRKISRKDISNAREFALKDFGKDLLDVVDNCERALSIFPEDCKAKGHQLSGIYVGLEMTANVMIKVFEKHGVQRIPVEPKETVFDPNLHEALFQQPVQGLPAGIIFALVKSGWTINGRVLRAAQVGVSADPPEEEAPEEGKENSPAQ